MDTSEKLRMMVEGESIEWLRKSQQLRREITIYPEKLTPEQRERLNQIEKELVEMADEASEETRTKTMLKTSP
jgi:hypothetical protein